MRIAFSLGSPDIGGGTYVIFQHARYLTQLGHEVHIFTREASPSKRATWYARSGELMLRAWDELAAERIPFDLALGTWWRTIFELHEIPANRYAYFVQSIESRFYPDHEVPLRRLVDSTYELGLPVITEATWIRDYLAVRHSARAILARNGIDKAWFTAEGDRRAARRTTGLRVLVEGPVDVAFKNVPDTVTICRQAEVDEVWLLTSTRVTTYPGVDRVFSRVPMEDVAAIYRSCDVLVKLSFVEGMFGPPLEMFHCGGTAITYAVTGSEEYMVDGENGLVAPSGDRAAVINALRRLMANPDALQRLKDGAKLTAQSWPDWDRASSEFASAILCLLNADSPSQSVLRMRSAFHMASYVVAENYRLALADKLPHHVALSTADRVTALRPAKIAQTWREFFQLARRDLLVFLDRKYPVACREISATRLEVMRLLSKFRRRA